MFRCKESGACWRMTRSQADGLCLYLYFEFFAEPSRDSNEGDTVVSKFSVHIATRKK